MNHDLLHAITGPAGETITRIELRRATVRDLRAMDAAKGEIDKIATMIRLISTNQATGQQLTTSQVDLMDAEDFTKVGEVVAGFFGESPPTGKI